ncbi:pyruvate dehydrogenase complex dihydrolipoamide acetyltransferase [Mesorhizobium sp. ANAO-SY3R2]|uniref:pyruvate dehydrogenase complex dihydrolipoamide acetyltransferase n=1 Tax=Mesorhizobium sp. ANAO-SY3R2 TaxID=3166644 RepID=UPI00367249F0
MPIEIKMPSLSAGMEAGTLARWLKAEGDMVVTGEIIAEIETDKATMELEATASGRIGRLTVAAGTADIRVDSVIALILAEGESVLAAQTPAAAPTPVEAELAFEAAPAGTEALQALRARELRAFASPLARRLAVQNGIDLASISGSGPRGRIVRLDVERASGQPALEPVKPAAPTVAPAQVDPAIVEPHTRVPHSSMRKVIARRLLEAKTTIPHFYLGVDCEIDALLALRAQINAGRDTDARISVNDMVVKAAATALRKVPAANAVWTSEAILLLEQVDISVAVATDGGLITPIVRRVDEKSLGAISREIRDLATRGREGRLKPEDFQGGGFSVSNLGMYGVREFSAIINPPQSCILAVGAAERRPICRGDDIVAATMMSCTLSVDHRSVDGALGAQLLAAFKAAIEQPMTLLV